MKSLFGKLKHKLNALKLELFRTQVHPSHFERHASNTELHLLSVSELEDTVAAVVSQYLHHPVQPFQPQSVPTTEPTRATPDEARKTEMPLNGTLGKESCASPTETASLDRMIGERTALVERFDADFVKQEIARKRAVEWLKEGKVLPKKAEPPKPKVPSKATREVATQSEKAEVSSESSTTSETASESSEESEESEEADESTATSTEEESASESSTSSSRETVLENKFFNGAGGEAINRERRHVRSKRSPKEPPKALSPTSLYLKQLREKILKERMEKI
ncbi:hypothetical protein OSTOST_24211 [Ostertagia ostertagi]